VLVGEALAFSGVRVAPATNDRVALALHARDEVLSPSAEADDPPPARITVFSVRRPTRGHHVLIRSGHRRQVVQHRARTGEVRGVHQKFGGMGGEFFAERVLHFCGSRGSTPTCSPRFVDARLMKRVLEALIPFSWSMRSETICSTAGKILRPRRRRSRTTVFQRGERSGTHLVSGRLAGASEFGAPGRGEPHHAVFMRMPVAAGRPCCEHREQRLRQATMLPSRSIALSESCSTGAGLGLSMVCNRCA